MEFEWEEAKRLCNLSKHRLDFLDAWQIFEDPLIVEGARHQGEERRLAVGLSPRRPDLHRTQRRCSPHIAQEGRKR